MVEKYSRSVLRVVAAQLSQGVGFDSIHSSSLDILTDVFERYLLVLGKTVHDFSEKCGQTQPHLSDVEYAFRQLHVSLPDMIEYMQQMEPIVFPHKVSKFPAPKSSNFQFPSGYNPADFERDEHIPLYMPSMLTASNGNAGKSESQATAPVQSQSSKPATFVIAGKHSQDSSSDEDDYSAGDISNEEYMSDDYLAHNPIKSRHLTKPEDIPTVEGTAPSSMMSVPSSSELDELRGSLSPMRHFSLNESQDVHFEKGLKIGKKSTPQARRPSQASDDIPWLSSDQSKSQSQIQEAKRHDSWASQTTKSLSEDPKWMPKKSHDKYDADWLHEKAASPVHLTKPPTPDGGFGSPKRDKQPWFDDDNPPYSAGSESSKQNKKKPLKSAFSTSSNLDAKSKTSLKTSPGLPHSSQKASGKHYNERKMSHKLYKPSYKNSPSSKKSDVSDEPIKARIEAAEKLIHSPPVPPYIPASPKSTKRKTPEGKSPVRTSIEKAEKLLKHPPVENLAFPSSREASPAPEKLEKMNEKRKEQKHDRSNFASSKSMYDAIDAVINRASEKVLKEDEEARKEAEERELMKFSHLVESSSSDSEPDVSDKVEQMLQLEERGLREARPPTPGASPMHPPTPSLANTPQSFVIDEEDEDVVVDSEDDTKSFSISSPQPQVKATKIHSDSTPKLSSEKHSNKDKHKKDKSRKSNVDGDVVGSKSSHKYHSKSKKDKYSPKLGPSFVTTETISEKPVKMKVKLKKNFVQDEPKLFDVDRDRDRIRVSDTKHKSNKEDRHKPKEDKHHKTKEHKKHAINKSSSDIKPDEHDLSVEKIILKKSKSGDAKVVKPKIKEPTRSPSPPSPIEQRSHLPLPKLSAAVPVLSVTAVSKDKEKKKSKKEKKKKKEKERNQEKERHDKDRHHDKQRSASKDGSYDKEKLKERDWDDRGSSRKPSKDTDSPLVPKLTLKMGSDEKKFIIKSSSGGGKSSSKKRSSSYVGDSPVPAKERKVSVETVKSDYEMPSPSVERKVITQTISAGPVGVYEDEEGNKIWICPGCNKPDDGSPMIGCDTCDDWYHWPCVNITKEPPDDEDWYCPRCTKRRQLGSKGKLSGKKKKKK